MYHIPDQALSLFQNLPLFLFTPPNCLSHKTWSQLQHLPPSDQVLMVLNTGNFSNTSATFHLWCIQHRLSYQWLQCCSSSLMAPLLCFWSILHTANTLIASFFYSFIYSSNIFAGLLWAKQCDRHWRLNIGHKALMELRWSKYQTMTLTSLKSFNGFSSHFEKESHWSTWWKSSKTWIPATSPGPLQSIPLTRYAPVTVILLVLQISQHLSWFKAFFHHFYGWKVLPHHLPSLL